jgi:hypothetical protein
MPVTGPGRSAQPEGWRESSPEIATLGQYLVMGKNQIRRVAHDIKAVVDLAPEKQTLAGCDQSYSSNLFQEAH